MRSLSGSPEPALPALHPLALILAAVAPAIWGVAGLALALTLLVLAPLVLVCRSWPDWRWGWLCRPAWLLEPWPWLCRCWLLWPWLCRRWLSQPRDQKSRVCFNKLRQGELQ